MGDVVMTIRSFKNLEANTWDWAVFSGCFGSSKMSVSDLDGIIERRGNFLVIETKLPGVPISMGQSILFSHLSEVPGFTVIVVWGNPGKAEKMMRWPDGGKIDITTEQLRDEVSKWYQYANSHSRL